MCDLRTAGRALICTAVAVLLAVVLCGISAAADQPADRRGSQPAATPPPRAAASVLDNLLKLERPRDWTLKVTVNVHTWKEKDRNGMPIVTEMDLRTAAVVFPANLRTASSELDERNFRGRLMLDDRLADEQPAFQDGYPAGTRLARWQLENVTGREVELQLEMPITAWRTVFDEKAAGSVQWPSKWSPAAASTLRPDTIYNFDQPVIRQMLTTWTEGKDPRLVPPVTLAKYLAGKVLEHAQPSGDGLKFHRSGMLNGVDLLPASVTAEQGRGSEHDIAVLLTAVYRGAGLPARTVIGLDVSGKRDADRFLERGKRSQHKLRSWVEFCLYDEKAEKELWVPVDIVRLRGSSNRAPPQNRPWKYFGTHDELDTVIPFAFQFHPPTTVVAHGSYAFWGWLTTPNIPQVEQFVRFDAQTTPKRSTDPPRDRR